MSGESCRDLFDGHDVVDVAFQKAGLDISKLTDVDALVQIAENLDVVFYAKIEEFGDVVRGAAEELKRLRTELIASETSRRTLARQVKALRAAVGDGQAHNLPLEEVAG